MKIYKNILVLVAVFVLTYFLANQFGSFYNYLFPQPISGNSLFSLPISESAENGFIGTPLVYIFFLTLLFTAFGGGKKYWWIGVLLIPAAAFELYFDFSHIYFPIALGVIGWAAGFVISKLLSRINKTNAAV